MTFPFDTTAPFIDPHPHLSLTDYLTGQNIWWTAVALMATMLVVVAMLLLGWLTKTEVAWNLPFFAVMVPVMVFLWLAVADKNAASRVIFNGTEKTYDISLDQDAVWDVTKNGGYAKKVGVLRDDPSTIVYGSHMDDKVYLTVADGPKKYRPLDR
ncbi:hypothetical protein [Aeromicrobium sp. 179-A 4D2 NHS]|uniref:hypothetical protein n=1 Tax=Aeromicrobium sp. 179-A 4D2 NHS TaxID=3142375 RepID=UPI00399F700A